MKKFLVYSIILLSSLFCFDNVKAIEGYSVNFDYSNEIQMSDYLTDDRISKLEMVKNILDTNFPNYYYVINILKIETSNPANNRFEVKIFPKNQNYYLEIPYSNKWYGDVFLIHSTNSFSNENLIGTENITFPCANLNFYDNDTSIYLSNGFYNMNLTTLIPYSQLNENNFGNNATQIRLSNLISASVGGYYRRELMTGSGANFRALYYASNIDLIVNSNYEITNENKVNIIINNSGNLNVINQKDIMPTYLDIITKPKITFNNLQKEYNSNNEIISESVDVILNNFDNTKYIPQYSTSLNTDWIDIINYENFNYKTNVNETLYVRLIDLEKYYESADSGQELVIDVIDTSSIAFTQIVEQLPYIKYKISHPDNCKYLHELNYYNSCVLVNANIENMNFNKYKIYYTTSTSPISLENFTSVDTTDWGSHYANVFNNSYSQDTYIGFKIIDISKNEVAYYRQIYANGVRQFLELGLTIDFRTRYFDSVNKGKYVRLFLTILNDDDYTYFYSLDEGVNYNQINNIKFIDNRNLIKEGYIDITKNGKVLIKALNSNNEVVKMFETIINYDELNFEVKNLFDYLNEYKDNTDNPLGVAVQAYNTIRNTPIGNYILIIIVSSIIILFVKSVKR